MTILERFWNKVDKTDSCWNWLGGQSGFYGTPQYGYFHLTHSDTVLAHKFSYEVLVGYILPGFELHHKCGNKLCVRPEHLLPVTKMEHMILDNLFDNLMYHN